jgi:endonuclease/exonuclease/phosphatase family metal-dependent hydrolase
VSHVRVVTANLLHGMALDGTIRETDLRTAIASLAADVLAVQEIDRLQPRSHRVDQPAAVAAASALAHWRFTPAVRGTPGPGTTWTAATEADGAQVEGPTYGIALFLRWPVRAWHVLRFPPARMGLPLKVAGQPGLVPIPDEPRVALAAVVDGPEGLWTVATTHLSFVPGRNLRQLRRVTEWLARFPGPRLVLGDFNVPGAFPSAVTGWHDLARIPTYPSWRPRVQWDHVLVDGAVPPTVLDSQAVDLGLSDHRALAADVDITDWSVGAQPAPLRARRRARSGRG